MRPALVDAERAGCEAAEVLEGQRAGEQRQRAEHRPERPAPTAFIAPPSRGVEPIVALSSDLCGTLRSSIMGAKRRQGRSPGQTREAEPTMATTRDRRGPPATRRAMRASHADDTRSSALALVAVSRAGWAWSRFAPGAARRARGLAGKRRSRSSRRTEIVVADAGAVWRRALPDWLPAAATTTASSSSSRARPGRPAPGARMVSGLVLLPRDRRRGLRPRLHGRARRAARRRSATLGLALFAARLSAEHLQRELGLLDAAALEMIGARREQRRAVQARARAAGRLPDRGLGRGAAPRIGPVPDGFYGQMVWSSRNLVDDLAPRRRARACGVRPVGGGRRGRRAAAFAEGYAAGRSPACTGGRGAATRLSPARAVAVERLERAAARRAVGLRRQRLGQAGAVGHESRRCPGSRPCCCPAPRDRRCRRSCRQARRRSSARRRRRPGRGPQRSGERERRKCSRPSQRIAQAPVSHRAGDVRRPAPARQGPAVADGLSVAPAPGERPKSGAAVSWPASMMPRRMARVRVK